MKNYFAILFFAFPLSSFSFEGVELCSSTRAQYLRQLEINSTQIVDRWIYTLMKTYQAEAGKKNSRSQIDLALDILICSNQKLKKGLIYHCVSDPKRAAWTLPIISRRVYLSEENFWPSYQQYQIAILIHEATHKCGTNDRIYFQPGEAPHNVGIVGWSTIADTYSYWGLYGLCIPGRDCT